MKKNTIVFYQQNFLFQCLFFKKTNLNFSNLKNIKTCDRIRKNPENIFWNLKVFKKSTKRYFDSALQMPNLNFISLNFKDKRPD